MARLHGCQCHFLHHLITDTFPTNVHVSLNNLTAPDDLFATYDDLTRVIAGPLDGNLRGTRLVPTIAS
jgi:hypothetical protein